MYGKPARARAGVEYGDQKTRWVGVKSPLPPLPAELQSALGGRPAFAVIWTTTPWTLPANLAIAVHPTQEYVAVEVGGEAYIVARALLNDFLGLFDAPAHRVLATVPGERLAGLGYRHPWI